MDAVREITWSWGKLSYALGKEPNLTAHLLAGAISLDYLAFVGHILAQPGISAEEFKLLLPLPGQVERERGLAATFALEVERSLALFPGGRAAEEENSWFSQQAMRFRIPREKTAIIELYRRLFLAVKEPSPEAAETLLAEWPSTEMSEIIAAILIPSLRDMEKKHRAWATTLKGTFLARHLRLVAAHDGRYPIDIEMLPLAREVDMFGGGGVRYDLLGGGEAELSLPMAEERWQRDYPQTMHPPTFRWRLGRARG
jgi:hypothetical protein